VAAVTRSVFEYALLRAVPRVERGEHVNVGVLVQCRERVYLGAAVHVDEGKILPLAPDCDVTALRRAANAVVRTCAGEGPAGDTSNGQRFRWLTAPRSTVLQPGPVHAGLTDDPAADLQRLLDTLVR
jgi:hypothetical protein